MESLTFWLALSDFDTTQEHDICATYKLHDSQLWQKSEMCYFKAYLPLWPASNTGKGQVLLLFKDYLWTVKSADLHKLSYIWLRLTSALFVERRQLRTENVLLNLNTTSHDFIVYSRGESSRRPLEAEEWPQWWTPHLNLRCGTLRQFLGRIPQIGTSRLPLSARFPAVNDMHLKLGQAAQHVSNGRAKESFLQLTNKKARKDASNVMRRNPRYILRW